MISDEQRKLVKEKYRVWYEMGVEAKEVRDKLMSMACNKDYQKILTKKEINLLVKSLDKLDQFRSDAEDRMFSKEKDMVKDLDRATAINIFYGDLLEEGEEE